MRPGQRGLSLLELNVSIVIAALILFSIFQLIAAGMSHQVRSRINAKLAMMAQRALEVTRMDVYGCSISGQPLSSIPASSSRQKFAAPDDSYGYTAAFYNYETFNLPSFWFWPPSWGIDSDDNMYMISMQVIVDGPLEADGITRRKGYGTMQIVTLMHYPNYKNSNPPCGSSMPASLHPPPPSPPIPIGMP